MGYDFHSLCSMFPLLPVEEQHKLTLSISERGVQTPITLYKGKILDGRNRYICAISAQVKDIPTVEFKGTEEEARDFVVRANILRRHLTVQQRAQLAADMATAAHGGARNFKWSNGHLKPMTVEQAAKTFQVSPKSVRRAKSPKPLTTEELVAAGHSPKAERYHVGEGKTASRVKVQRDEVMASRERIAELEAENARLKSDLEALQTGNLMRMSQAALTQRRELAAKLKTNREARLAVETLPDAKTKEAFEREIKGLKTRLRTEQSKIEAFKQRGNTVLDKQGYKAIRVCLHPDGATDPNERARRENAFKLFSAAVPEPAF